MLVQPGPLVEINPDVDPLILKADNKDLYLVLLAEGQSNKEISGLLLISEPTVKKHVGQVLKKLSVQDRLQAGLFVARHPLLFTRSSASSD